MSDLVELIRSSRLAHGERLPGENQLAEQYQVSRGTVRSALSELQAAGLVSVAGDQWISTERLDAEAAELLGRSIGELFLRAERTSVDAGGGLVERVTSLLDPDRFQFHLTFGHR